MRKYMDTNNYKISYTIKDQAYEIIKEAILNGDYKPGDWLQEPNLANQLNISRSPVREALRRLEGDGLVINVPNKGVFVKEMTEKEILDIFEIRLIFEGVGIKNSRETLTAEICQEFEEIKENLYSTFSKKSLKEYIKFDTLLHEKIMYLSGNHLIINITPKIYVATQPFRTISLLDGKRWYDSINEHSGIIDNIIEGRIEEAWRINKSHLELAKEQVILYFEKNKKN